MNEKLCLYMPPFSSLESYYEMVDIASEYGLKHLEPLNYFEFETPDKDFAVKLKEYADKKGIDFPCFSVFINLVGKDSPNNIETVKKYADIAKILGCTMLHHTIANEFDDSSKVLPYENELFPKGIGAAREIFDYCKNLGIKTVFEGQGYLFNGCQRYKRLLEEINREVGILVDFGNIYLVSETADDFINLVKGRATHVHIKDVILTDEKGFMGHKTLKGRYLHEVDIGQGIAEVKCGVEKLKRQGYSGLYSLEYTAPTDDKDKFKGILNYVNSIV